MAREGRGGGGKGNLLNRFVIDSLHITLGELADFLREVIHPLLYSLLSGLAAAAGPAARRHHGEPEPRAAAAGAERERDVLLRRHQLGGQRLLQPTPARHTM